MLLLSLFLSGVFGGGWATSSFAEKERSLTPITDTVLDRRADQLFSLGISQITKTTLATPAKTQAPIEMAEESQQSDHHLRTVPGMKMFGSTYDAADFALEPAGTLAPSRMLQGIQTLGRDAATENPLPTFPQH